MIRHVWREWIAPALIIVAFFAACAACAKLAPGCVEWSADFYHW